VSEWNVLKALDTFHATATGLDGIPAWLLRLDAPVFALPLAQLLNLFVSTSTIPAQWKQASISPVPKTACPTEHYDFRPLSITPVLSRVSERLIVRHFLYPAFLSPPSSLTFFDQYAFRPTGSTTASLVSILASVTGLLASNNYVVVALDFSRAFDTAFNPAYEDGAARSPRHCL